MHKKNYIILLIEQNTDDVAIFQNIFKEINTFTFQISFESTLQAAIRMLDIKTFDIVFTDIELPDSTGINTLIKLTERYPQIPFVVLTSLNDDETGFAAIESGAQDYLVKGNYNAEKMWQTIRHSCSRKQIANQLKESTDRFKNIAENIQDGLTIIENQQIIYINSRMTEITGFNKEELNAIYSGTLNDDLNLNDFFKQLNDTGDFYGDESLWIRRKDGRRCYLRNRTTIKKQNGSKVIKYIATTDITDHWRSESIKEFVNKIASSANIVNNEQEFFKIIYKEIHKIFNDKQICLGILKDNGIDFLKIENKKISIEQLKLKESLCSILLENNDARFFTEKELLDLNSKSDITIKGSMPKSWMGASLYNNQKKHGILVIKDFENPRAFNQDDLDLLVFIAKQITLAIQKSKYEEKIHQLSLSVEQSPAAIEITDVNGTIEYVNDRFVEITGYKKEEVLGKNPRILKSGKTTPKTYTDLWQAIEKGNTWKGIFINKKKTGEIYYEEASISPILNHENKTTHYVGIKEDISDRIKKEKELLEAKEKAEESERKVKDLLVEMQIKNTEITELLTGAKKILEISSFDKTAQILFDSCKKLTGAKAGYVALLSEAGEENNVVFLDDGSDDSMAVLNWAMPAYGLREKAYINKQPVYHNDFNNSGSGKSMHNGHVLMKNVLFAPLILKNQAVGIIGLVNKPSGFTEADAGIVAAFSELASLALFNSQNIKELKVAKEKAEESDELKSSFLANMSHEVRTPMNGIIGFSQFLKDPELSHENKLRYINIINESCQQLLSIVEDILEISKLETGQIEVVNQEFNPEEIANNIYITYQESCTQKGLDFTYNKNVRDNKFIVADKIKVMQILKNLMSNALKFTHEGNVELGINEQKDFVEYYIKDTGIGIEPELKDKIFDRFRQAETAMARTYGGTGLGLAIAKGYIELMNGEIRVESEKNRGSTFFVKIPYNEKVKTIQPASELVNKHEPIISFNKAKVLIAEDEEINFQYIKRVFNDLGIDNIERAHNGKEAIEIMERTDDISLIMMDLKMPVINGFEATRKIKSMNTKVPIIAQTALAIPGDKQRALEAGCDDYIPKPIDYNGLLDLIEKFIIIKG